MAESHERLYERDVTKVATRCAKSEILEYELIIDDLQKTKAERLFAYCVVFTFYRRLKETNKCIGLYEKYKTTFGDEFIIMHFLSIAVKESGRRKDLVRSIDLARKSLAIHPRHVGALHNLAGSLFRLAEEDGVEKTSSKVSLHEARDIVEEVIELESDYPKFYATKAEILSAQGDHKSALREIVKAIDREDSSSSDYSLRISDYLARKLKIELRRSIESVTEESRRELLNAMNEARKSNLEILSFFVAVISFVIAGINIAVKFSLADAVQLIFVLSASMLMTISGFTLLYDSSRSFLRFIQSFLVGFVILLIGLGWRQIFK